MERPVDRQLIVFRSELGWMGIAGSDRTVERLYMGHDSADEVRARLARDCGDGWSEHNWWPELRSRLTEYAAGSRDDFRDIKVGADGLTAFGKRVVAALRRIGYGKRISYGELAEKAGAPGAARAVGTVMSHNRVPLIVPCHRVIAAGGKLGGFSAPQGLSLKRRLLELETAGHETHHSSAR
jgi:methylated-DNA-[protein]-cysteine S-methyltransferase